MVEAMVALTLVDALMLQQAQCEIFPNQAELDSQPNPMGSTAFRQGGPRHHPAVAAAPNSGPISQRVDEE